MKRYIMILLIGLMIVGCSRDDDAQFDFQLVNIRDVILPDTLVKGESYNFIINYNRPTRCHAFAGFDYNKDGNERTVAVISAVEAGRSDCQVEEGLTGTTTLSFIVERDDFYTFKFYQGEDTNGEFLFLTREIPVQQE